MKKAMKAILFDIDGTVANLGHRLHFITNGCNDWDSFNKMIPHDTPIEQTVWLQRFLSKHASDDFVILFASGRSENERKDTEEWLAKHGLYYDKLYMRWADDKRADYIIKREILDDIRADGFEPFIVFDDRQTVVDMWRENGLFVLQCDPKGCECRSDIYKFHETIEYPLTIMVGPSGAGKDTWLKRDPGIDLGSVISSDTLRAHLTGDFRDQSQNERVFQAMHEMAQNRLKLGLPVVLNATHIRRADRVNAVKLVPDDIPVRYIVINRSLEEKRKSAGWRNGVFVGGIPLINKHDQIFKSNLKYILDGDGFKNVSVFDLRK